MILLLININNIDIKDINTLYWYKLLIAYGMGGTRNSAERFRTILRIYIIKFAWGADFVATTLKNLMS